MISSDDLEHLMDTRPIKKLIGKTVDLRGAKLKIVQLKDGRLALKDKIPCHKCLKRTRTVYRISGLHTGAWCYVANIYGKYEGNLRDEVYTCSKCRSNKL